MIGTEFIPEMDQGEFILTAKLPLGTSLEETNKVARQVEDEILKLEELDSFLTTVGQSDSISGGTSAETASFQLRLKSAEIRERSTDEVMESLRKNINIPDTDISLEAQSMAAGGMMGGSPISITIKGDDLEVLERLAIKVKEQMSGINGVREIKDTISEGRPELHVNVNRAMAAQFGLRINQIGSSIKTAVKGQTVTRYEINGEEYDLTIKLDQKEVKNTEDIKDLLIPSPTGARVPLRRIADFSVTRGPKEILRDNQIRYVNVTASLYQADLGTVMEEIKVKTDKNIDIPTGYQIEYGGQYKEMQDSFKDLFYAFLLAIVLVYMVMASQFESLLHPFVVMFTVPMALIGVLLGLFIFGKTLSVVSIIGVIMLAGIVVNNAIVLVDYINTVRRRGNSLREAILEAGPVRLRPILMTALTTILGLLPLALGIGEGTEVQTPMAIVVIGGLSIATLLTLYVVPVIYSLLTGFSLRFLNKFGSEISS